MKRSICIIVLAILVFISISPLPLYAHWSRTYYGGTMWVGSRWGAPDYGYYPTPPVIIRHEAPVYVQPPVQYEEQYYWYYCQKPQGYYPYVKRCPGGWLKVVPSPAPEDDRRY